MEKYGRPRRAPGLCGSRNSNHGDDCDLATYRCHTIFCRYVITASSQRDRTSTSLAIPLQALRAISKVHAADLRGEFAALSAQALYCASRRVVAVSVFPEGCWWSTDGGTHFLGSIARVQGTSEAAMTLTVALDSSCSSAMRIRCAPSTF